MPGSIHTICICGAGTMGTGIAQVAAQSGYRVMLFDQDQTVLEKARTTIDRGLLAMCEKKIMSMEEKTAAYNSIRFTSDLHHCRGDLVIEAIVEKLEAKVDLFNKLALINTKETFFATNTSSLSVTDIALKIPEPSRLTGMHFFNPAPLMKLVEVVTTSCTSEHAVETVCKVAVSMNKTPVVCKDLPGFIVNRVARPYYLEALKLVELGIADFETIDTILEATGFKMGPFRLMDLIGNDVNFTVTKSLYEACGRPHRFRPSPIQQQKLELGELGRKTGKGYYHY